MGRKGFVLHSVPVVVILIGIIAVGYFYFKRKAEDKARIVNNVLNGKPSTKEEDKWTIYNNSRFGYEISLPSDWQVNPVSSAGQLTSGEKIQFDSNQAVVISLEQTDDLKSSVHGYPNNSVYLEVLAIPVDYGFENWWHDHKEGFELLYELDDKKVEIINSEFPTDKISINEYDNTDLLVGQARFIWDDSHLYIVYIQSDQDIKNHPFLLRIADSLVSRPNEELIKWKRNTHPSGFSIQIPGIATVVEGWIGEATVISVINGRLTRCGCGLRVFIDVEENPDGLTIPEWWNEKFEQMDEHSRAHAGKDIFPTKISDYQAYFKTGFGGDSSTTTYFIAGSNKIYSLSYSDFPLQNNPENTWQVETYEKIIQSFRIESNGSAN